MTLQERKAYESKYFEEVAERALQRAYEMEDHKMTSVRFKVELQEDISKVCEDIIKDILKTEKALFSMEKSRDWYKGAYKNK